MRVAIVAVGDEILAGHTVNTNAAWLGRQLTERGADVERAVVVPDRIEAIAGIVAEYHEAYDAVVVTGGLGPTHDDVTMAGVAAAFDRELAESEAVLEWLATERDYARSDLTDGTAAIPDGARPLHNEVGVAPGCVLENCYVLPGVPEEMKPMFERVAAVFDGNRRYTRVVRTTEPESALLDRLADVRERFDVAVGCYPGDSVRVRFTGTDEAAVATAADWLAERVDAVEGDGEQNADGELEKQD